MQNSSFKIGSAVLGTGALLKLSALGVAVVMLGAGATANAGSLGKPCTLAPEAKWLPMQQLQAKVEVQGYKVQKAKLKNACGELYTLDQNGNRVELFVDPTNGQIIGQM